jgi:hypothetical protein
MLRGFLDGDRSFHSQAGSILPTASSRGWMGRREGAGGRFDATGRLEEKGDKGHNMGVPRRERYAW